MYHSNTHHSNTRRYTLQDLIHDKKFQDLWNLERFVAVVTGIIRGMSFLHSKKVIHRDLKPENIMLSEGFEVKIVDFGVSREYADRKKTMTGYVGTPCYMVRVLFFVVVVVVVVVRCFSLTLSNT